MQAPRHVLCAFGSVVVVQADNSVIWLREKELSVKLELLFSKSLYIVALNIAHSQQACRSLWLDDFDNFDRDSHVFVAIEAVRIQMHYEPSS